MVSVTSCKCNQKSTIRALFVSIIVLIMISTRFFKGCLVFLRRVRKPMYDVEKRAHEWEILHILYHYDAHNVAPFVAFAQLSVLSLNSPLLL